MLAILPSIWTFGIAFAITQDLVVPAGIASAAFLVLFPAAIAFGRKEIRNATGREPH